MNDIRYSQFFEVEFDDGKGKKTRKFDNLYSANSFLEACVKGDQVVTTVKSYIGEVNWKVSEYTGRGLSGKLCETDISLNEFGKIDEQSANSIRMNAEKEIEAHLNLITTN